MSFHGRAWYNLLRMNHKENPNLDAVSWQIADYRAFSKEELFKKLKSLGIHLNEESFFLYTEKCASPEELVECLLADANDSEKMEKAYVILFELWRTLCPEKQTLSIFCDELDSIIEKFDETDLGREEIEQALIDLENVLDTNVDRGEDPKKVFQYVCSFLAHDLESFLYDFASLQIDAGEDLYASELVDGFYKYVEDPLWFDFIRVKLIALVDSEEAIIVLQRLLEQLQEQPDLDLLFEALSYVKDEEEIPLFFQVFDIAQSFVQIEGEFHQLLEIVAEYMRILDREVEEKLVRNILTKRKGYSPEKAFASTDKDLQELKKLASVANL